MDITRIDDNLASVGIEGADIERHKQVILNNEHSDDYFIERVKSLSLKK